MKVALVGVGRWGRLLAGTFERESCIIVGHVRSGAAPALGLGQRLTLAQALDTSDVIVCAAPPGATLDATLAAVAIGRPVLATKPFLIDAVPALRAPLVIDYWRIFDPLYKLLKANVLGSVAAVHITLVGNGPFRDFPGLYDYGPHALAFLGDLLGPGASLQWSRVQRARNAVTGGELFEAQGRYAGVPIDLVLGNGAERGQRILRAHTRVNARDDIHVLVEDSDHLTYLVNGYTIRQDSKVASLVPLVRSFLADARTGVIDTHTAALSVLATAGLRELERASQTP